MNTKPMADTPHAVHIPRRVKGELEALRRVRYVACNVIDAHYINYGWQLIGAFIVDGSKDNIDDNIQVFAGLVISVPDYSDESLPDGTMAAGRDLIKFYRQTVFSEMERRYGSEFAESVVLGVRGEVRKDVGWIVYT